MDDDQQRQIEVSVRDSMSVTLRAAAQTLDNFNRTLLQTNTAIANSLENIRKQFQLLDEEGKKTSGSFGGMEKTFGLVSKALFGPVGIIGGFTLVTKTLNDFAASQLNLSHTASNVGVSVRELQRFQQQASRAGIDPEKATAQLGSMHAILKDIFVNPAMSSHLMELRRANPVLASNVENLLKQGKEMEAMTKIRESYFRSPEGGRYRAFMEGLFGVEKSVWEMTQDKLQGVPELWQPATEAAKAYLEKTTDIWTTMTNIKNMFLTGFILADVMGKPGEPTMGIGGPRGFAPDVTAKPQGKFFTGAGGPVAPGGAFEMFGSEMPTQPESIPSKLKRWFRRGAADDDALPQGATPASLEGLKLEEESNESLLEIRDILTRIETGATPIQQASGGTGGAAFGGGLGRGVGSVPPMGALPGGPTAPGAPAAPSGGGNIIPMTGGEKLPSGYFAPGTVSKAGGGLGGTSASMGAGRHGGDDLMMPHGSPVHAVKDGVIEHYGRDNQGGMTMRVRHDDGTSATYMHLSRRDIPVGGRVEGGKAIGLSGTANRVPHLHFELRDAEGKRLSPRHALGIVKVPTAATQPDTKAGGGAIQRSLRGGTTSGRAEFLAEHRSNIMKELQDPKKLERLMGLAQAEVGSNPKDQQAFVEYTVDRWAARGQNVEQGIANSYYGRNPRYKTPSSQTREQFPGIVERAGGGSAMFPGATGNASGSVLRHHIQRGEFAGMADKEGVIFEKHPADIAFRKGLEAAENDAAERSRAKIDDTMRNKTADARDANAKVRVDFSNMEDKRQKPAADEPGVFKILNLGRAAQGGRAGGGAVKDFNRFAFE